MVDVNSMENIEVLLTQIYTHTPYTVSTTPLIPVFTFKFNGITSVCNIFSHCLLFNIVQGVCQHAVFLLE